jgi:ADP-ribose pyrophosphatase YjhB (NUDIX family)
MTVHPPTTSFTRPVVGVGAVIWKGDHLLLIQRGHPPGQGTWTLPGGRQELGETVFQAVEREVREETGLAVRILDVASVVDLIDRDGEVIRHHYTVIDVAAEWVAGDAVAASDAAAVAWVLPSGLDVYGVTDAVRKAIALAAEKRGPATPAV